MNKAIIIGNLTKDVDSATTANGIAVAKFTVAVPRRFANANGEREVDFLDVVAWRGLAENCTKYLGKGRKVAVVGTIQKRSYDAQDGTKRYITEIVADEVEFLSPQQGAQQNGGVQQQATEQKAADLTPIDDDTLPF